MSKHLLKKFARPRALAMAALTVGGAACAVAPAVADTYSDPLKPIVDPIIWDYTAYAPLFVIGTNGSDAHGGHVNVSQGGNAYGGTMTWWGEENGSNVNASIGGCAGTTSGKSGFATAIGEPNRACPGGELDAYGHTAGVGLLGADIYGGTAAVSDSGDAHANCCAGMIPTSAVSGTGSAYGNTAVSGTGRAATPSFNTGVCTGIRDVTPLVCTEGVAVSGLGTAYGRQVAIAGGDADSNGLLCLSLTGTCWGNARFGFAPLGTSD